MSRDLPGQLNDAWLARKRQQPGLTLVWLLRRTKLRTSVFSLSRKLRGEQTMTTRECQRLASALNVTVTWPDAEAA